MIIILSDKVLAFQSVRRMSAFDCPVTEAGLPVVDKGCSLRRSDLPAANRDARPLAPQSEEAAKGLRLRSLGLLSYFSRQRVGRWSPCGRPR